VEGAAEFLGAGRTVPDRPVSSTEELERVVGPVETVLGEIPSPEKIAQQLESIEEEIAKESRESMEMAQAIMHNEPDLGVRPNVPKVRKLEDVD
jgi:hypothetical protein